MGINIGTVIITMLPGSMKQPRNMITNCVAIMMNMGCTGRDNAKLTIPLRAPLLARILPKLIDPTMITNTMTVISIVPIADLFTMGRLNYLYRAAKIKQPMAQRAAASDGVAIPMKITPMAAKIIAATGTAQRDMTLTFFRKGTRSTESEGARE